jgi:HB1, ASXL, restriction endonuclease HTH domain
LNLVCFASQTISGSWEALLQTIHHSELLEASEGLRAASDALARLAALDSAGPKQMRTLADYAKRALEEARGPLRSADWAERVRELGYRSRSTPKNPRQLEQSLSSLPHHDSSFVRVGRGTYDLAERHPEGSTADQSHRNPPWSDDELTLALELYLRRGQPSATDPEVQNLSRMLNRLSAHARSGDATFRNPNGVAMKLGNLSRYDPAYAGRGLSRGNHREKIIWDKYARDREALLNAVRKIHDRL